jgi:hypothetical protein
MLTRPASALGTDSTPVENHTPNQQPHGGQQGAQSCGFSNRPAFLPLHFSNARTKISLLYSEFALLRSPDFRNLKIVEKSVAKSGERS